MHGEEEERPGVKVAKGPQTTSKPRASATNVIRPGSTTLPQNVSKAMAMKC